VLPKRDTKPGPHLEKEFILSYKVFYNNHTYQEADEEKTATESLQFGLNKSSFSLEDKGMGQRFGELQSRSGCDLWPGISWGGRVASGKIQMKTSL
jgi:hypothetical protein